MDVHFVGLPTDPEPAAVYLQELAMDLAEAAGPTLSWQASLGVEGITLECAEGGFGFRGGDAWRVEIWGDQRLKDALKYALLRDERVSGSHP
ncbi:MAG: hypothetical protein EP330_19910 [Deltaproteobacteria bacterium]|nr:MAG: hypothetical protein EP330_19910 [Deltaproteobacteria bacterium]